VRSFGEGFENVMDQPVSKGKEIEKYIYIKKAQGKRR
jgi:hypothetical protein